MYLKVEDDASHVKCLDQARVFALKMMCQSMQAFITHKEWGYDHLKTDGYEIVDVLLDQCHILKIPGYEKITRAELEQIIEENQNDKSDQLNEKFALELFDKIFDGDGSDFAVDDHLGLFHIGVIIALFQLAGAARALNLNVALLSKDSMDPIVFKQNKAIGTIYVGSMLNFDNPELYGYIKIYSEYCDKKIEPSKLISDLVARAPCSYEPRLKEQTYSPNLFNSRLDNGDVISEEVKSRDIASKLSCM